MCTGPPLWSPHTVVYQSSKSTPAQLADHFIIFCALTANTQQRTKAGWIDLANLFQIILSSSFLVISASRLVTMKVNLSTLEA